MKVKKSSFRSIYSIKYLIIFVLFLIFNSLEEQPLPYSISILALALVEGFSPIISPLLFLLTIILSGATGLILSSAISALILSVVIFIYDRFEKKPLYETAIFVAISLIGFILIGDTTSQIAVEKRIIVSFIIVIISFFAIVGGQAITKKGLKFKMTFEEILSLAILTSVFGVGLCNLTSPLVWKCLSVAIILSVCYLYRTGIATIVSAILGISLAIYFGNINYVSVYIILAIVSESLVFISRYVSAVAFIVSDYLAELLFGVYSSYSVEEFLPVFIGALIFCVIPSKPLVNIKEKLYSFREKQLVRQSINRNRATLSGRLYDLSSVFAEMASAFNLFNNFSTSDDQIKSNLEEKIYASVCKECEHFSRCASYERNLKIGLSKLIDIGFAKGKISLIDMPKEIGDICFHPNSILFSTNKALGDYKNALLEKMNVKNGRDLLANEALGIAEILRGLAFETGSQSKYNSRGERNLSQALFKEGFLVDELLIFGEEDRLSVNLILVMKEFSINKLLFTISSTLGVDMTITEKVDISEDKCYISFRRAPLYDAVFGLSSAVKDGKSESGDTHAVTRLNRDRFLVALSDGMGSGKRAREISSTSLSLIESFYKAGLNTPLILSTVNKLLSINTEDSFTALDVAILNLFDCSCDFIKYGSPYGFIIGKEGVRIVEGNNLPLGIIDELKPSVCTTSLNNGDIIVLISDGISDAFGSSSLIIDFLRSVLAKNPQTLSDKILEKALMLNNGKKNDDMTVLTVRIYKRKTA